VPRQKRNVDAQDVNGSGGYGAIWRTIAAAVAWTTALDDVTVCAVP